jgi:hypothetical protein
LATPSRTARAGGACRLYRRAIHHVCGLDAPDGALSPLSNSDDKDPVKVPRTRENEAAAAAVRLRCRQDVARPRLVVVAACIGCVVVCVGCVGVQGFTSIAISLHYVLRSSSAGGDEGVDSRRRLFLHARTPYLIHSAPPRLQASLLASS